MCAGVAPVTAFLGTPLDFELVDVLSFGRLGLRGSVALNRRVSENFPILKPGAFNPSYSTISS